ncbi:MAG: hypothetical protein AAGA54_14175 [Myxococcota bacterium]
MGARAGSTLLLSLAVGLTAACSDDAGDGGVDTEGFASSTGGTTDPTMGQTSSDPTSQTSMPPGTEPATSGPDDDDSDDETGDAGTTTMEPETTGEPPTTGAGDESSGGGERQDGGEIDVTLTGCAVDFGGSVVVTYNGSLGVASVYDSGATLTGSFQFDLDGAGTMQLSSQHRVDTGNVINMVDIGQGTWTNLDSDALVPGGVDTIGGTLVVESWNPSEGEAVIGFQGVSLRNVVDGGVCTIDGTVTAETLYP